MQARKLKKSYEPFLVSFTLILGGLEVTTFKPLSQKKEEAAALPGLVISAVAKKLAVALNQVTVEPAGPPVDEAGDLEAQ